VIGLAVTGAALVAVSPSLRVALPSLTSDLTLFIDERTDPTTVTTGPITITGHTNQPAEIEVLVDEIPVEKTRTGPDHRFRLEGITAYPESSIAVKATVSSWFGAMRAVEYPFYRIAGGAPAPPRFLDVSETVNRGWVLLKGRAYGSSRVVVTSPDTAEVKTNTERSGAFSMVVNFPRPGRYTLTGYAEDWRGARSTAASAVVTWDPTWTKPAPPEPIARRLTIIASRPVGRAVVEVALHRHDERARGLVTGTLSLQLFLESVFGDVELGLGDTPQPLRLAFFATRAPEIEVQPARIVIRAWTDPRYTTLKMPAWDGSFVVALSGRFDLSGARDVLEIKITDYDVRHVDPPPNTYKDGVVRWEGGRDDTAVEKVRLTLTAKAPTSRAGFFAWLRTPTAAFVPVPVARILGAVAQLAPALVVLALGLIIGRPSPAQPFGRDARLARSIRLLLVLTLIVPSRVMAATLDSLVIEPLLDVLALAPPSLVGVHVGGALGAFVIALVLRVLVRALRHGPVRNVAEPLLGAAWIAAAIVLTVDVGDRLLTSHGDLPGLRVQLVTPLILAPVFAWLVTRPAAFSRRRGTVAVWFAGIVAGILLTFPLDSELLEIARHRSPRSFIEQFASISRELVLYVLAWAVVVRLRDVDGEEDALRGQLAVLVFATYLVGLSTRIFWLPVPFLLALLVAPHFVLEPAARRRALDVLAPFAVRDRRDLASRCLALGEAQQFREALEKLDKKTVAPADYEKRKREVDAYIAERERATVVAGGLGAQDLVLAVGGHARDWTNARTAVKHGAVLALPLFAVYVGAFLSKEVWRDDPFLPLEVSTRLVGFTTQWFMAAFFFGYFFKWIRGGSGLTKGVRVAIAVLACLLPARIASFGSLEGLAALALSAGQTFLFFALLGVWAFDYRTSRQISGGTFAWRTYSRLGDIRTLAASASILLTSVGLASTSVITGQFTSILSALVRLAFPAAPK